MKKPTEDGYVTTRELAAELRSMRWEFRFLIATAVIANSLLLRESGIPIPGVQDALSIVPFL